MTLDELTGGTPGLAAADYAAAAAMLRVNVARVRAVDQVESNGRGLHPETGRPTILFEPHVFSKLTNRAFDETHPHVSYPTHGAAPYPAAQAQRYAQLAEAMALDETAALKSASWGRFQIMGFNWRWAGGGREDRPGEYGSVQGFVRAMARSEGEQLKAFVRLIAAMPEALTALQHGDFAGFARAYNGPGYAQHGYDQKLKAAYAALTGG